MQATTNTMNMDLIIQTINGSKLWHDLNQQAKSMYDRYARVPSEEEYQALRNIIMCKVILEDDYVRRLVQDEVWKVLQSKQ